MAPVEHMTGNFSEKRGYWRSAVPVHGSAAVSGSTLTHLGLEQIEYGKWRLRVSRALRPCVQTEEWATGARASTPDSC